MPRLFVLALLLTGSLATAEPLPVKAFAHLPDIAAVTLSPDGRYLSLLRNLDGDQVLVVTDLPAKKTQALLKIDSLDTRLDWYRWANQDTLLVATIHTFKRHGERFSQPQLFKYRLGQDSKLKPVLSEAKQSQGRREYNGNLFSSRVLSLLPDAPHHILVEARYDTLEYPTVYRVDLRNGHRLRVQNHKGHIERWYTDQQDRVRLGLGVDGTRIFYRLKELESDEWRILWEYEIFEAPDIRVLGFGLDPNTLYLRDEHQGRYAVFKVNLASPELERELVYADPRFDVDGGLIYDPTTRDAVGIRHGGSENGRHYWDPHYLGWQEALDRALPDADNRVISTSADRNHYVLYSESDSFPGDYFLGNRKGGTLDYLGSRYPAINDGNYRGKTPVVFEARDGLSLHGYLTRPLEAPADKALPTVILPHGGPMAQSYANFDYTSALLANQGYQVFEPNFRGSEGYGFDFAKASIQNWGGTMQDDLEDAAHYLIRQGLADKARIGIVGGSYGGYAALMAAARQGETFRCAAAIAPVTDLDALFLEAFKYDLAITQKQIGTDRKQLAANSPLNLVTEISVPVLLVHGTDDKVVHVDHSRRMAKALKRAEKPVDYLELEQGDHHLSHQPHRIQTMEALVDFLEQHLRL